MLTSQYDVATVKLGSEWRSPTLDEIQELIANCIIDYIMYNGIMVHRFTGNNGNYIILPYEVLTSDGYKNYCHYLCSTYATCLEFMKDSNNAGGHITDMSVDGYVKQCVRPVKIINK